jgi:hypothetical protein
MACAELRIFSSRMQAEMAKELLTQAGIPALIQSDDIAVFGPGHPGAPSGVKLLVREEYLDEARGLIEGIV